MIPAVGVADLPDPLPDDLAVLDVREQVEWDHGHLPHAVHVPLPDLTSRTGEVPGGRVLVVCRVGARSAAAVDHLRSLGHDAVNLDGGLLAWADAGRPLVDDRGEPGTVV